MSDVLVCTKHLVNSAIIYISLASNFHEKIKDDSRSCMHVDQDASLHHDLKPNYDPDID